MKQSFFNLIFMFSSYFLYSQLPNFEWANGFGGRNVDIGYSILTDASGNVYTAGTFQDTVDFNSGAGVFTLSATGNSDIFITKHDQTGSFLWAKRIGGNSSSSVRSMTSDNSGNLYLSGSFYATTDFDTGSGVFNVTSVGANDAFVCKLDSSGDFIFVKTFGGINSDNAEAVCLDVSGNIYLTGTYRGLVDFDPGMSSYTIASEGATYDLFVNKLDSLGAFVWAQSMGGNGAPYGFDNGNSIAVDAGGNVYICGGFQGSGDFDPGPAVFNLTSVGDYDIYLGKLNSAGNFVWAIGLGGNEVDEASSLFVRNGHIYMNGKFTGIVDFDPGIGVNTLMTNGIEDIFVCKFDTDGNLTWAKNMGGAGFDMPLDLALDNSSHVYSTGFYFSTSDFDPGPGTYYLSPIGSNDIFISKLDSSGNFGGAASLGSTGADRGWGITTDENANVYVTGQFSASPDLNPGPSTYTIASNGSIDIFMIRLGQCNYPVAPFNNTDTSNLIICAGNFASLNASSPGIINWYATPTSTISLTSGSTFITPPLNSGNYTYYAEAYTCAYSPRTPIHITVDLCSAFDEILQTKLSPVIFPNPTDENVQMYLPNEITEGKIILFNSIGQKIYEERIFQGLNNLKTNGIKNGIYSYISLNNSLIVDNGTLIIK